MRVYSSSQAIHEAFALGFRARGQDIKKMLSMDFKSTRGSRDMNWQHVDKLAAGLIMDALSSLPAHLQDWAVWCHGPRIEEYLPEQGRFFAWLNDDVAIRLLESERAYRPGTAAKVRDVVAYAVLDYRSYTTTGRHEYSVKRICKECGIVQNNWHRDFKTWHDYGWTLCDRLDAKVLPVVGKVVRRINFDPRGAGRF
ncbi:hypothetical protein [Endozoicomonas acroporae]|uniref:hypothetical protein n=1 Tax=Endozoicomonas acroporae TaxID=1701104 RepID=UPI0013D56F37|nr:hypothetical protein [Endozoicomonas acroporae]